MVKDPQVAQAMPRLERALDRAIKLATDVLTYGKTQEAAPVTVAVPLLVAIEAAAEEARLGGGVTLVNDIDPAVQVQADPDQLHRILVNLMRNARQAMEQAPTGRLDEVRASFVQDATSAVVRLSDNGPGVSERAQERLFQAFAGSSRPGGAGLGLAIARELAQGHGGELSLASTGPDGSTFELRLPGVAPRLDKSKRKRASKAP